MGHASTTKLENYDIAISLLNERFGIEVPRGTSDAFRDYISLIRDWNLFAGLVSPNDIQVLGAHLADSLSLAPYLRTPSETIARCVDIGSGAGFPAVPLAVIRSSVNFTLWESNQRKASFIRKIVSTFHLSNCTIRAARFQAESAESPPDYILSRAVSSLEKLLAEYGVWIDEGAVLLYQGPETCSRSGFSQEIISDEFTTQKLRRSSLSLITKA